MSWAFILPRRFDAIARRAVKLHSDHGRDARNHQDARHCFSVIYLSGHIRADIDGICFMFTPHMGNKILPGRVWAADNGRYSAPSKYTDAGFLEWLGNRDPSLCLFATAPDIVGDHAATVKLSTPMLHRIRDAGYPAAFVAQDGFDEAPWDDFDCLFIGGTTNFKLGPRVPGIVSEAKRRGKWVHMGRVNSYKRLRVASVIGCDSADGTFLKFGPDINTPRLLKWLSNLHVSPHFTY